MALSIIGSVMRERLYMALSIIGNIMRKGYTWRWLIIGSIMRERFYMALINYWLHHAGKVVHGAS